MKEERFYVKSLEEDFATKSLNGTKKVDCQNIYNIVKTKSIKPNTKSFGRNKRLSCTILHDNYTTTYRPQGIIFKTDNRSDYIIPFDLVLLSATNHIIVHYYRIKNNLHVYYNHTLIPGFEKFIFKDFESMIKRYSSPEEVWKEINKFRKQNGYKTLPKQKFRLAKYNEVVFHKTIKIKPMAIFGYRPTARKIARELNLPHYVTAKQFYQNLKNQSSKNALIIGRFQPIHKGHLNLIKRYSMAGYFIKIAIGSSDKKFEKDNPLTAEERENLIKKALKENSIKNYKIYHVPDIKSDKSYVSHVLKIVGSINTILTGNPYILKLFLKKNAKNSWNIEAFEETSGRPGGKITSGIIRKLWLNKPDKKGLTKSSYNYLIKIGFTERLKKLNK